MNYGLVALATVMVFVGIMLWDVQASALPDLPPSPPPDSLTMQVEVMQLPQDALTRDAVYMGAMTFAGLALFSSTMLARVHGTGRSYAPVRRVAAFLVLLGSFGLATVQLGLAGRMCCDDPEPLVWNFVLLSFILTLVAATSYLYLALTDTSSTPEQR